MRWYHRQSRGKASAKEQERGADALHAQTAKAQAATETQRERTPRHFKAEEEI